MPLRTAAAWLCAGLGALSLAALPALLRQDAKFYSRQERFFTYPIPLRSSIAPLRRDSNGKGHFGAARDGGRKHEGVDLLVPVGMPVFAAKSGRVVFSGTGKGYGEYIELLHPDGLSTRYAHLSELCAQKGDWVPQGGMIGTSGKTGNARDRRIRAHLHFEIREKKTPLDPTRGLMDPSIEMR